MALREVTAEVNQRLQDGMALMQEAQTSMGQRLDEASRAVTEVHGQLGALGESTRRMEQVGRDIAGLEQILRAPKMRGGFGETLLERPPRGDPAGRALPPPARLPERRQGGRGGRSSATAWCRWTRSSRWRTSAAWSRSPTRSGAASPAGLPPDVRKLGSTRSRRSTSSPTRGRSTSRSCTSRPRTSTTRSSCGTTPSEDSLLGYSLSRRVVPVSPNSFYAYLQVILLGLRGLRIEQNAREILGMLGRLQGDAARVREHFDTLGRHITNAKNKYDEATTSLARLEGKIEDVAGRGGAGVAAAARGSWRRRAAPSAPCGIIRLRWLRRRPVRSTASTSS